MALGFAKMGMDVGKEEGPVVDYFLMRHSHHHYFGTARTARAQKWVDNIFWFVCIFEHAFDIQDKHRVSNINHQRHAAAGRLERGEG